MMEENCPYIVQMTTEREETSSSLVRPYFDLVVVSSRDEERLGLVKIDASYRSIMLLESVNESPHAVIP